MNLKRLTVVLFVLAIGAACALRIDARPSDVGDRIADLVSTDPRVPPRKRKKLLKWLLEGSYLTYAAEPAIHDSLGPHGGNVRTFFNEILVEDLRAGRTTWSKGAAMVKELYFSGTTDVRGYSVMIKTRADTGPNGEGWIFYETLDGTNNSPYYGRGLRLCVDCHRAGTDLLQSAFRPA